MNSWMVNIAFSVLFGLIEAKVIPLGNLRAFKKLAKRILNLLPDEDYSEVLEKSSDYRIANPTGQ